MVSDASNVGGGASLYQFQQLSEQETLAIESKFHTLGILKDGKLKHDYDGSWTLVPLGHWN